MEWEQESVGTKISAEARHRQIMRKFMSTKTSELSYTRATETKRHWPARQRPQLWLMFDDFSLFNMNILILKGFAASNFSLCSRPVNRLIGYIGCVIVTLPAQNKVMPTI